MTAKQFAEELLKYVEEHGDGPLFAGNTLGYYTPVVGVSKYENMKNDPVYGVKVGNNDGKGH